MVGGVSGMEWYGVERSGVFWSCLERFCVVWSGRECGLEWSGAVWSGMEWYRVEWRDLEWCGAGSEWFGVVSKRMERFGVLWSGLERSGVVWCDLGRSSAAGCPIHFLHTLIYNDLSNLAIVVLLNLSGNDVHVH